MAIKDYELSLLHGGLPGQWTCDLSRHNYWPDKKKVVGHLWEAVDNGGKHHFGVASTRENGGAIARKLAGVE
jgi:hypothetical protein